MNHTRRPSPLNDFRELTSPAYLYVFITFFSQLSEAVRPPLPITRAAKVSIFHEEKKSDCAPGPSRYTLFANNDETPTKRQKVDKTRIQTTIRQKRFIAVSQVRRFFDETKMEYSSSACRETIFVWTNGE